MPVEEIPDFAAEPKKIKEEFKIQPNSKLSMIEETKSDNSSNFYFNLIYF